MRPDPAAAPGVPAAPRDAYADYNRAFFRRWSGVYDLFSSSIAWSYGAVVREIEPGPGRSVLDLCTGTGEIALRCARAGSPTVGVDLSHDMLGRARTKARRRGLGGLSLELMDARRIAFRDRAFDVVVLSFALHDMPRPVRLEVLAEARRVARSRLVVLDYELPAGRLWRRLLTAGIATFETAYFPRFAAEGLRPLLAELGFERWRRRRLGPTFAVYRIRP